MEEQKVRIAILVEMDRYQLEQLEVSARTKVLGGKIARLDWEGDVFDEVDAYRAIFESVPSKLMEVLATYENLKDENFITELQLAIKKSITPILKAKRKIIKEKENEKI